MRASLGIHLGSAGVLGTTGEGRGRVATLARGRDRRTARVVGAITAALLTLVALTSIAAAVTPTQAAWTDQAIISAQVSAATWQNEPVSSCATLNPGGQPSHNSTCEVTGISFNQWTDGTSVVRDYQVTVRITGNTNVAPRFEVDLREASGSGTWTWGTAATVPTGHYTPAAGYLCSELPILRATGPTNWGASYNVWVRVVEYINTPQAGDRNCG